MDENHQDRMVDSTDSSSNDNQQKVSPPIDASISNRVRENRGSLEQQEREEFLAAMQKDFDVNRSDRGEMVEGTIVSIGKEFIFLDLGGKSEGYLSIEEVKAEDGSLPAVGETIEACVISTGPDGVVLSKRLAKGIRSREMLEEAVRSRIPVQGRVESRNKGGFDVMVAGVRGFCPIGQIELRFCENPDEHVGKTYTFIVTKYEQGAKRSDLVLSRKQLLQAEAEKQAEELRKTIREGDIIEGRVSKIMEFGAFVDLGGLEGLLHVSELSHTHVDDPRSILKEGEQLHVQVISIEKGGERISLSLKRLEADPWDDVLMSYPVGSRIWGKVVRMEPFGAFVEIGPGVDGLVHISNLNAPERVNHPRKVLELGRQIQVEVLSVDVGQRRIGLARVPEDGEFGELPVTGSIIEGKVDKVVNFGVFVSLGPGRKGLVPNVEMGTPRGADHQKDFPPATPIKVMVIEVAEDGKKIRLSRKAALEAEERSQYEAYIDTGGKNVESGFGTLGDLLAKKIGKK